MNFKDMTKMFLGEIMLEDAAEFTRSLNNLKENGVIGKAGPKGITISYNKKRYVIPTDCSEIPDELKEFEKDIKVVFKGKTHGAMDRMYNPGERPYHEPDPYKVGHRAQYLLKRR